MTLPVFKAVGTGHESSVAWPAGHAAGDFAICAVEHPNGTVTTPSGWTAMPFNPITNGSNCRLSIFYRFATSGAESNFAITGAADHNWGVIITYTGVNTLNPFHVTGTARTPSNTSKFYPGLQTFLDDCLILHVGAWSIDSAGPLSSTELNSDLASLLERYDAGTITGDGGGLVIIEGAKATRGSFKFTDTTFSSASTCAVATLALQAADKTFGQKTRIVNLGKQRMAIPVKQSTAHDFDVFMADSSDGKTGKTGLTIAVTLKKGGASSFSSVSPTVTELGSGNYKIAFTGSHNDTPGNSSGRATATGADPADFPNFFDVVAWDKTDGAALGLSRIDAAITSRLAPTTAGRTLDVTATGGAGIDWSNVENPTTALNLSGTTIKEVTDVETKLGAPAGASVSADIAAVKAQTAAIDAKTTNLPSDPADQSLIIAATDAVMARLGAPAGASMSADIAAVKVVDDAIKAKTDQLTFSAANKVDAAIKAADNNVITAAVIADGAIDRATFAQDAKDVLGEVRRFQAAAGTNTTVTFDAGASTVVDFYKGASLLCVGGTGAGQVASVASYSALRVATLDRTVGTAFDATSIFELRAAGGGGGASIDPDDILDAVYIAGAGTPQSPDRTLRGLFKRLGGLIENATGLVGSTIVVYAPDGVTELMRSTQTAQGASHTVSDVSGSE